VPALSRVATARRWTAPDVDTVAALREAAMVEAASSRGGDLYVTRSAVSLPAPDDAERPAWVGILGGAIVGYLLGRRDHLSDGRVLGVVDAIYVDAACRGVGVGEEMMAAATAWFRTEGCFGVDALALPGARATKNFFEESGFTARMLVMHHRFRDR